jgi:hypothetical protein
MHSILIIEGEPADDLVFGLASRFNAHAMQPRDLQRAQKRLCHCVVASLTLTSSYGPDSVIASTPVNSRNPLAPIDQTNCLFLEFQRVARLRRLLPRASYVADLMRLSEALHTGKVNHQIA